MQDSSFAPSANNQPGQQPPQTDYRPEFQPQAPRQVDQNDQFSAQANQPSQTDQPAQSAPTSQSNHQPMPEPAPGQPNQQQPPNEPAPNQTGIPLESELFPGQLKPLPEEVIVEWTAASRPFKKRNRQFYTTVAAITILISLILFFAGQFLPIAVVISVAFLAYVLSSVPPEMVKNQITTYGIRTEDQIYYWEELGRFWFETKYNQVTLNVETSRFPGRITLLPGDLVEADLTELLSEVLLNEKPAATNFDKASKWLQEKVPLEAT